MARRSGILAVILAGALLALPAYWMLFTTFMSYDDEGYVLISLKNYAAHGGLYSHVYSQYGPFFYLFHDLGHRIVGYDFTNTNGRLFTLLCWLTAAAACTHLVWRHTRSTTLAAFTLGLTFFHLWFMVSEPIHPGGLIAALVAIAAWWGARLIERNNLAGLAIIAGLFGAALLLMKINTGVFFLAAAGAWFAVQLRDFPQARGAAIASAVLLVLLPFGLMKTEFAEPWAQLFAALSAVASFGMVVAAWSERRPATEWRQAGWGAAVLVATTALIVGLVCLRGTGLADMLEGVLLGPLRHPGVYHHAPTWLPGSAIGGAVSLVLAVLVWRGYTQPLSWVLIGLRILLVLEFSVGSLSLEDFPLTSHSSTMSYGLPFAWIFVVRLGRDETETQPVIAPWIGLLLVLQYLHAYPVAGSQIAWGTFLIVPVMALGLRDTARFLARRGAFVASTAVGLVSLALATGSIGRLTFLAWHRYVDSRPLQLNGAEDIRVPEEFSSTIRLLSLNAAAQGDMLFTLPGLFSFNEWTQLPAPTAMNVTHWFSLLTLKQQQDIIAALSRSQRPVLIVHRGLIDYLADNKFVVSSPLNDYLRDNFTKVLKLGIYEFHVRRGRKVVPLSTAELLQLKTAQAGMAPNRLELVVAIPPGHKVTSIELATLEERPVILGHWNRQSSPLLSIPINLQGTAVGAEQAGAWDTALPPLVRLELPLDAPLSFLRRFTVVYLRDSDGSVTAEARFIE